jgi:hypothetical protein
MKIVFLCGSLEQGKDGVGDYTMKLAGACKQAGASVYIISINDKFVTTKTEVDQPFYSLRLPQLQSWASKAKQTRKVLQEIQPDLVSIQFVPYAFHSKGFVTNTSFFKRVCAGYPVQIMFHELWIGEELGASLRRRLVGRIQKAGMFRLLRVIKPMQVHTSNRLFQSILTHYRIPAKVLPIFGNIAIDINPDFAWLEHAIQQQAGKNVAGAHRREYIIGGIFGTIHPNLNLHYVLAGLNRFYEAGKQVLLISIGKAGPGIHILESYVTQYQQYSFIFLGEQNERRISSWMQFIDFGVTSTPSYLLDKSGSFKAMTEHGLPIVCQTTALKLSFDYEEENDYSGLTVVESKLLWNEIPKKQDYKSSLADVARQFLADVNENH